MTEEALHHWPFGCGCATIRTSSPVGRPINVSTASSLMMLRKLLSLTCNDQRLTLNHLWLQTPLPPTNRRSTAETHRQDLVPHPQALFRGRAAFLNGSYENSDVISSRQSNTNVLAFDKVNISRCWSKHEKSVQCWWINKGKHRRRLLQFTWKVTLRIASIYLKLPLLF